MRRCSCTDDARLKLRKGSRLQCHGSRRLSGHYVRSRYDDILRSVAGIISWNLIRLPLPVHHNLANLLMSARLGTGVRRLLSTSTRHTRPTALPRTSPLTSTPTLRNTQAGPRHYSSMTGTDKKDKNDAVLQLVQKIIPPLHPTLHKGQAGESPVAAGSIFLRLRLELRSCAGQEV